MYERVIPRDLFNESKLLKCFGQLVLLIENGAAPAPLTADNDGGEFRIDQREDDGGFYLYSGLQFRVKSLVLEFYSPLNCRRPYPLLCVTDNENIPVFDDAGELTEEFRAYVMGI